MAGQNTNELLLRLIEDISSIKTTVSSLENQLEKLDTKVVEPFSEWLHNVKQHEKDIVNLKTDYINLNARMTTTLEEIKIIDEHVKSARWYVAGVIAAVGFIGIAVYNIIKLLLPFLHIS